jgi:colanic acid/amylovoran biosynthesis glycosyltransferase
MRVAVIVNEFPAVSETFVLRHITGLIDAGHDVDIYAAARRPGDCVHGEVAAYGLMDRTRFVDMPRAAGYWEQPVRPLRGRTWDPEGAGSTRNAVRALRGAPALGRCLARAPRLTAEVLDRRRYGYQADSLSAMYRLDTLSRARGRYDVVHAHYGPIGDAYRFARRLWAAPYVVQFHGYDVCRWPRENGDRAYERLFAAADAVAVNSRYAADRLARIGCPRDKLRVLAYGVDTTAWSPAPRAQRPGGALRLLTVARLVEKKGLEYSIRAVARLAAARPGVAYDIVGEGPLREPLERLIADLGLGDTVRLHGARDADQVRRLMGRADVFVLSSVVAADGDEEGTPVSLLEAQAAGLPVVATRHAGIPEIVRDGQTALLVAERDVDGLADALERLAGDSALRARMGAEGRAHVAERNDVAVATRQVLDLYAEVRA